METDGSESGYVTPISCPHVEEFLRETESLDAFAPCAMCDEKLENWVCLTCFQTGCARFQKGHGLQHFKEAKHPIALSYSDLSFWCYECDNYVKNYSLHKYYTLAHKSKFMDGQGKPTNFFVATGNMSEEEIKEYYDSPAEVEEKVKQLAQLIKDAGYMVVYTGAGVSTSAKIPDYRGPQGVWTMQAKGQAPVFGTTLEQAVPTPTHMALVELSKRNTMKFLVSTNVDGLHRRSGITEANMSELHGNCYKESCKECDTEYLRHFDVCAHVADHKTARSCGKCAKPLYDSIINFGEDLPTKELQKAIQHANQQDLSLVLGTSMRVQPANKLPLEGATKMVIVNLQKTPYDDKAHLIIREQTDKVMALLFNELGLTIPEYSLEEDLIKRIH